MEGREQRVRSVVSEEAMHWEEDRQDGDEQMPEPQHSIQVSPEGDARQEQKQHVQRPCGDSTAAQAQETAERPGARAE